MTNFIALFPLKVVVFPEEKLNIHVFEPKFVQLIQDCLEEKKQFGILPVINNKEHDYGCSMELSEVVKVHEDGSMDIRVKALRIFKVLEIVSEIPDKLYRGAIVNYPQNNQIKIKPELSNLIIGEVKRLYSLLNLEDKFNKEKKDWLSYDIGHTIGLSLAQEFELLTIFNEIQRMEYIRRHLKSMHKVVVELEDLKTRIQLNGQFRDLT